MPTVPVYVPVNVARQVAGAWGIDPHENDFLEVVRAVSLDALEKTAGISYPVSGFKTDCSWARLHRAGHRCRHCGGSS